MKLRTRAALKFWIGIAAIAVAICGLGCGSDDSSEPAPTPAAQEPESSAATSSPEPSSPEPGPAAPSPTRRNIAMRDGGGTMGDAEFVEGDLPSDFPGDLPSYPGATPKTSMSVPGRGILATFSSTGSSDAILDFYRREFENRGWNVSDNRRGGLDATKEDRSAQISVQSRGGESEIAINLIGG